MFATYHLAFRHFQTVPDKTVWNESTVQENWKYCKSETNKIKAGRIVIEFKRVKINFT